MPKTRMDGRHYTVPVNCEKVSSRQTVSIERFSFTASCNNLSMVRFLVESGACLFASTLSDHETPAEKCEEDEEGFDGCSEYLYSKFALNSSHDRIITQSPSYPSQVFRRSLAFFTVERCLPSSRTTLSNKTSLSLVSTTS